MNLQDEMDFGLADFCAGLLPFSQLILKPYLEDIEMNDILAKCRNKGEHGSAKDILSDK
jgi:hypothetical protein